MAATTDQMLASLERAQRIRLERQARMRALHAQPKDAGRALAAAWILDPPEDLRAMPTWRLLSKIRKTSDAEVVRWLSKADALSPFKRVEQLTPRQQWFRSTIAGGRWATDPGAENTRTGFHMKCHRDGTVDLIRLEAGTDSWRDLGGKGAYDTTAGRV